MFGYVKTDLPNMYVKDTVLYKAIYCGLCKGIGRTCGQKARLLLNYDLTFLSVFLHNLCDKDVEIKKERCIIHHIVKRPVAPPDELTYRIAYLNVILARYKLSDDVIDGGKGRLKRAFFSGAYKKAKRREPVLDEIVKRRYEELLGYEKAESDSVDMVADPFGNMMKDLVNELAGDYADESVLTLSYDLGKWIYLIDALDDFDKDKKKKEFNVFVNAYKDVNNKEELIRLKGGELAAIFGGVLSEIFELTEKIGYKFNHDIISNVLRRGLTAETKRIMEIKQCRNTTKS